MKSENWLPVCGGAYEVSSLGRIRRVLRASGTVPGKIVRQFTSGSGYLKVTLSLKSRRFNRWVHRLVAGAFLGRCPPGHNVNHRDGMKSNNAPSNLQYVTFSANTRHAIQKGLLARSSNGRFANGM